MLALVQIYSRANSDIQDYFKEVYTVKKNGDFIEYGSIVENDFNIIIFPDIGLNTESLVLSNLRIAPVQIAPETQHRVVGMSPLVGQQMIVAQIARSSTRPGDSSRQRLGHAPGVVRCLTDALVVATLFAR